MEHRCKRCGANCDCPGEQETCIACPECHYEERVNNYEPENG